MRTLIPVGLIQRIATIKPKSGVLHSTWLLVVLALFSSGSPAGFTRPSPALVPVCLIQGEGAISSYRGQTLLTGGIVHADFDSAGANGFYIQEPGCDPSEATSDGLFVHLTQGLDLVSAGDRVQVSGEVRELYGMTEIYADPTGVAILSHGETLPTPIEIDPPADRVMSQAYFEAREGMRVRLAEASVVGPTDSGDQTWVLASRWGITRLYWDQPGLDAAVIVLDDGGLYEITPEAKVGDKVESVSGALQQRYDLYRVQLNEPATLIQDTSSPPTPVAFSGRPDTFTLASFNLGNLFDTLDDPLTDDDVLAESTYQRRLGKIADAIHSWLGEPQVLALQEAENLVVLEALATQTEIQSDYGVVWQDGPDLRGLDVAFLYDRDRAQLLETRSLQGCTRLVDGLGPDGNQDVLHPENQTTCDSDGNGHPDGNRLFSRPPLLVHLHLCLDTCSTDLAPGQGITLWVLNVHWKSKIEDTLDVAYTAPRRAEQAAFVRAAVQAAQAEYPGESLVVAGDFNDNPGSFPRQTLEDADLSPVSAGIPRELRYSYNYRGISELPDDFYFLSSRDLAVYGFEVVHINADAPTVFEAIDDVAYRSSDHDPVWIEFLHLPRVVYLPVVLTP